MVQRPPRVHDTLPDGSLPIVAARQMLPHDAATPHGHPVSHGHASLVFHTGGEAHVEQAGAWRLNPGDVLLVPAGTPHRMLEGRAREGWCLSLCAACLVGEGAASLLEPFERVRDGAAAVVRIPTARHAYFAGLFRELERVGQGGVTGPLTEAVQRSLLTLILAEVDQAARTDPASPPGGGGVVAEALRFIERNAFGPLSLEEIAAAVGRSPAYVTTALSRATGRSAIQWVVAARMGEARRRLLHSDERIDVIAERVGYADATHFIRMFRREHRLTPAAWRAASTQGRLEAGRPDPCG